MVAGEEVAGTYSILHSYLFDRRGDLRLPTVFLVSAQGEIVKLYREPIAVAQMVEDVAKIDVSPAERLARALPFPGNLPYSSPGKRNYFQYGLELSEQGFDVPALGAFERVAKLDPSAITFYNLGTLYMRAGRSSQAGARLRAGPRAAARQLRVRQQPGSAPRPERGRPRRDRALPRRAADQAGLTRMRSTTSATRSSRRARPEQALELYQKALSLRPDFPEAYNNLGIYFGQRGDLDRARESLREGGREAPRLRRGGQQPRPRARGQGRRARPRSRCSSAPRGRRPGFEPAYVTLARIYLQTGRRREGIQVLELLLQRNPATPGRARDAAPGPGRRRRSAASTSSPSCCPCASWAAGTASPRRSHRDAPGSGAAGARRRILLKQAAAAGAGPGEGHDRLGEAARRLEAMTAGRPRAPLRDELQRAAAELRQVPAPRSSEPWTFDAGPYLELLDRFRARLQRGLALGLAFQGSYSQTKVKEPVYGGHASAMGPPPCASARRRRDRRRPLAGAVRGSPLHPRQDLVRWGHEGPHPRVRRQRGRSPRLRRRRTPRHLPRQRLRARRESRSASRTGTRSIRNLGGWKFEDVSQKAGVDAAAWGNGVCAGDFDGDGRLDLYVTNWGPNLLFRNNGDGTFSEMAAAAGVEAGGWSTGCTFFDADGDGDLDLYVARYVDDDAGATSSRAQRTPRVRGTAPRSWWGRRVCRARPTSSSRTVGTARSWRRPTSHGLTDAARGYGFGVVATDYDDDGWIGPLRGQRLDPELPLPEPRRRHVRERGPPRRGGRQRRGAGPGRAWVSTRATTTATAGWISWCTTFAHDTSTLYRNLGGGQFEDVTPGRGPGRPDLRCRWAGAPPSSTPTSTAGSTSSSPTATSSRTSTSYPELNETFGQKNQLL